MTPQESVTAYESWCSTNKSYRATWKEAGAAKQFDCHYSNTMADKIAIILPLSDEAFAISIFRIATIPSFEGYKEWLQYQ